MELDLKQKEIVNFSRVAKLAVVVALSNRGGFLLAALLLAPGGF